MQLPISIRLGAAFLRLKGPLLGGYLRGNENYRVEVFLALVFSRGLKMEYFWQENSIFILVKLLEKGQ